MLIFFILLIAGAVFFVSTFTGKMVNQNGVKTTDKFCGRSTFSYCSKDSQCISGGCGNNLCGDFFQYKKASRFCLNKKCYEASKYNLECGCYKSLCQWRNVTK
mgnify:CR=1 FL=1